MDYLKLKIFALLLVLFLCGCTIKTEIILGDDDIITIRSKKDALVTIVDKDRTITVNNQGKPTLFEAIINSFHAIEEFNQIGKGKIEIHIHRDKSQRPLSEDDDQFKVSNPITGFSINDNGIGFNSTNYESFRTADTRLKETQGGKGIGRFR